MNAHSRRWIGCWIAAATSIAGCGKHRIPDRVVDPASRERAEEAAGEREEPGDDDYFYLQRRLPDGRMNLGARARADHHARFLRARNIAFTGLDAEGKWELRGPINVGGRVTDVVGDPANANKFYVGAASGGVWKTTDGGATFTPIFDGQGSLSIGALALDPRDSNILYVGTGEANPGGGSVTYPGDGVWKTTDGGATWQHLGLDETVHDRQHRDRSARTPTTCSSPRLGNLFCRIPIAASIARRTAVRPGPRCCSCRTARARSISRSIRWIPRACSPRRWERFRSAKERDLRRPRAAACSARPTAARRGRS